MPAQAFSPPCKGGVGGVVSAPPRTQDKGGLGGGQCAATHREGGGSRRSLRISYGGGRGPVPPNLRGSWAKNHFNSSYNPGWLPRNRAGVPKEPPGAPAKKSAGVVAPFFASPLERPRT